MPLIAPLLLTTALVATPPANSNCANFPASTGISVDAVYGPPKLDHTKSYIELSQLKPLYNPYGPKAKTLPLGLTQFSNGLHLDFVTKMVDRGDGATVCAGYDTIRVLLSTMTTIYIAKEIPENSCWFRETLKHERKHFDVAYNLAQDYRAIFRQTIQQKLGTSLLGPFPQRNKSDIEYYLKKRFNNTLSDLGVQMQEEGMLRQQPVDNMNEYNRIAVLCKKEAAKDMAE